MPEPIVLSSSSSTEANNLFDHWLNHEPVTLIVVFGNDTDAKEAVTIADQKINSADPAFTGVRVVKVPKPAFILNTIRNLNLVNGHPSVDWDNLQNYVLMSISHVHNNIGQVITRTEYRTGPDGTINLAVIFAQAADGN